jgi:hypothetical protein
MLRHEASLDCSLDGCSMSRQIAILFTKEILIRNKGLLCFRGTYFFLFLSAFGEFLLA